MTGHKFQLSPDGKTVDHAEPFTIPIEKGTVVMVDVTGLHINRKLYLSNMTVCVLTNEYLAMYWGPDAEKFKPQHFIDTDTYRWPRDACKDNGASYQRSSF